MSADLGENVEKIGEYAFYGCSLLSTVSYGGNLRTIGSYAFEGCERLSSVSLPDTVESIGTYSFHNTAMWKNSGGVVYADNWVVGCTSVLIGSVALRAGTVGIGNYAFYGCIGLTDIYIPESVQTIGKGSFFGCGLPSVTLPAGLKKIGDYAFYNAPCWRGSPCRSGWKNRAFGFLFLYEAVENRFSFHLD